MIIPPNTLKIHVVTDPVDFRQGMDGLAAIVSSALDLDPFSSAIVIFRSKQADRLKLLLWDGTGMVLVHKRLEGKAFAWQTVRQGAVQLTKTEFEALFEGLDWRRITAARQIRPRLV